MGFFNLRVKTKLGVAPGTDAGRKYSNIPIRVLGKTQYKGGCSQCSLDQEEKNLEHPKMEATGSTSPLIYVLGEAPGKNEDLVGEQFIGKSGELIRDHLPKALEKHVRWNNTVQCRPPGNRTPTEKEMACCSQRVEKDIEASEPLVVIGFGSTPLRWATDESNITDWRGELIPIRVGKWSCWYAPIWHPAYMLRKRNDKKDGEAYFDTFKRDMRRVFDLVQSEGCDNPYIPEDEFDEGLHCELSWDVDKVAEALEHMRQWKKQSVDIETNEFRPYNKSAKILSIAFGTWKYSYSIPILHSQAKWSEKQLKQVWGLVAKHMRHKDIEFWAHHLKFETEWLTMPNALGREALFEVNWQDTMAQSSVLATRGLGALSLNSRSKALIGVAEKALDALDRKNLDSQPLSKVLRYNARDAKFQDLLRQIQETKIKKEKLQKAYALMVGRVPALTLAQQLGVVPDTAFASLKHVELKTATAGIEKKIQALAEVKELANEQGQPFNSASTKQLTVLLRDKLEVKEGWRQEKGPNGEVVRKYSTDEKTLGLVKHPIAKLILEKRGLEKLDGTYVLGLCPKGKEKGSGKLIWDDGLVHTVYNYLKTTTGRLSSEDPNLQNFPKREHKEIRAAIMAMPGWKMVSVDYGQIEARVIAMASLCPVLCKAIWEGYDIHMAWTKIIAEAHPQVMVKYMKEAKKDVAKAYKLFRSDIKNEWTFPLFFGSQLESVARMLDIPPRDLKPQFNKFWQMFAAVKVWQEKTLASYKKNGYVETLTGRRRYEPLGLNEVINSPIQGTASDIVVDAMSSLALEAYKRKRWQLAARMNIHDDLTFYLPEQSLEEDLDILIPIMCQPHFDFVVVPITVEVSIGDNWGEQEEFATVESTEYGYPNKPHL